MLIDLAEIPDLCVIALNNLELYCLNYYKSHQQTTQHVGVESLTRFQSLLSMFTFRSIETHYNS